jgi:16S rRNA (adenine1518-N6/adenine1519-N6)-dimethyltransferase
MEDDGVLIDIVSKADVNGSSLVLEIGPGTGAMTKFLLSKGALVTAVEKDDRLSEDLYAVYAEVCALIMRFWYIFSTS